MTEPSARSISGSRTAPTTRLTWSDDINKRIRTGGWEDQAVSTTTKIIEAIERSDWESAAQLLDYWMEEAKVVYVVYQVWSEGWQSYLDSRGVPAEDVAAELHRLRLLLAFPDGEPFEPKRRWEATARRAGELGNRLRTFEITQPEALVALDDIRES